MKIKIDDKKKAFLKETFDSVATALVLALIIRSFILQPFKIPTGSMESTLMPGDRILVSRFIYGFRIPFTFKRIMEFKSPQRGDIIVFNYPEDTKRAFIKRCLGMPEDNLEIKNGEVWINGNPVKDIPINSIYYYNRGTYAQEGEIVKIPTGAYFALGDNSASSRDSRYWGFLEDRYVIGKALFIYWPLNRIRLLK